MPRPKKGARLGSNPSHQKLMMSNLAVSLFEHESVTTTEAKAKALRPFAEKLITKAKKGSVQDRRVVLRHIEDRDIVHKLFSEIAPRFTERNGGYTRILKLGPRNGDGAPMALIELVEGESVASGAGDDDGAATRRRIRRPGRPKSESPVGEVDETEEIEAEDESDEAPAAESEAADDVTADASETPGDADAETSQDEPGEGDETASEGSEAESETEKDS